MFVFLSLMEYALVNIVMGDIADVEKKKSMGISNLILGKSQSSDGKTNASYPMQHTGMKGRDGSLDQEVCMISIYSI